MKYSTVAISMLLAVCLAATTGICASKKGEKIDAGKAYEKHCSACHPKGGNIINTRKPLDRKSLNASGVKGAKDIVAKMRNPGPGMTRFDEKTIPNREALAIAEYILKTFR